MRRDTKKDFAYRQIKQMFLERRFEPETMLSENEISVSLGMSRTPVREALQVLQNEGFVTVYPKRGVMFKGISTSAAKEILELRAAVEGYVAVACLPLSAENIQALETLLLEQKEYCDRGDVARYLGSDVKFHIHLVDFYDNSLIQGVLRSINERFMSVGLSILHDTPAIRKSYEGHVQILEAAKAQNSALLLQSIYSHIDFGKTQLLNPKNISRTDGGI